MTDQVALSTVIRLQDELTAANERIREWSDKAMEFSTIASRYEEELSTEREVLDKLVAALKYAISAFRTSGREDDTAETDYLDAALAEVAAKRPLFETLVLGAYALEPYQRRYFALFDDVTEPAVEIKPSRAVHGPQRKGRGGKIKKW